ncbi:MAG TPA: PaaI family thioesterase [Verrucomicrobiae bacterium]|jgi:acyl-coenzyme A thioesterase PaaI-like protein|nr:PaaI family thioesterase [Verrucomicrobiae bacterium]
MIELPHSKSCFVCGSRNIGGLNLRFHTDGRIVRTRFTARPEYNGFVGVIHGGILATILDEVMVWACSVQTKRFFYCAELSVRYRSPAAPGDEITAEGELIETKRERLFLTNGKLARPDGSVVATATGKYIPVSGLSMEKVVGDFEGSPEQLRAFLPGLTVVANSASPKR